MPAELTVSATEVYRKNHAANTRFVVNQGGSRSSKTYSLCQLFIVTLMQEHGQVLTIARKTFPALRMTVMRDFFEVLNTLGLYDEKWHNKTDSTYYIGSNLVEFVSMDQPQKKRGAKRTYLWLNEANEFSLEDFRQLNMRTTGRVFLDFNPSDEFHWIYDEVLTRPDCTFIQSTYKDNPFLAPELVKEIERYKEVDENYWRVYGLGERGVSEATIYPKFELIHEWPAVTETIYGLDFGYTNPTAFVRVGLHEKNAYLEELIYQSYLTDEDTIQAIKEMNIPRSALIYCDTANPQGIEKLKRAGFNAWPSDKSVHAGIKKVKEYKLHITAGSLNLQKEMKSYKWKTDSDGKVLDEPVKLNDHIADATRYAIHTYTLRAPGKYHLR